MQIFLIFGFSLRYLKLLIIKKVNKANHGSTLITTKINFHKYIFFKSPILGLFPADGCKIFLPCLGQDLQPLT